jgi:putative chitinase
MSQALQRALVAAGYAPGPIDGQIGPRTKEALRSFQRDRGLTVDGIAGPQTMAALGLGRESKIDAAAFARFAPNALPGTVEAIETALRKYPVLAEAAVLEDWLGQMWVESKGFSTLTESLNYSVEGLRATFGRHRISDAQCEAYGRKPGRPADQQAIANIVYGGEWGRKNLGNIHPNDGWEMRGSGVKQITGRANIEASGFTAEELRTDIVKSVDAAARFFIEHNCVEPARIGDITGVTKRVNGGTNGLADRVRMTGEARKVIR